MKYPILDKIITSDAEADLRSDLKDAVSNILFEHAIRIIERDGSDRGIMGVFNDVAPIFEEPACSFLEYEVEYQKGFVEGILKCFPSLSESEAKARAEDETIPQGQDFTKFPKSLALKIAWFHGYKGGCDTGKWYAWNEKTNH